MLIKIYEAALRYPDRVAVQIKDGNGYRRYTYQELTRAISSLSRSLLEQGIGKGNRVAILSENRPEWIIAYFSVLSLGAVIVPLDAQLSGKEVELLLASSEAKAVFVSNQTIHKLPLNGSFMTIMFDHDGGIPFSNLLTAHPNASLPPMAAPDDIAALLYTSGTTGDPKGVMLSHGNLASNCMSCIKLELVHSSDNMLCILPLHHTYAAMASMLLPLSLGVTVTILNSLKGPDILACMQETKVSIMLGVPQLFLGFRRAIFDVIHQKPVPVRFLVKVILTLNGLLRRIFNVNIGKVVFGKIHAMFGQVFRLFASGGARLDADVFNDMTNLGFTIIEGYGLTETSPVCTFNPVAKQKAGSIGIPIPDVEVRIANPDENGQGEIAIRGPNVMIGYYRKQQETMEVLRNGWFYSGDLGYKDNEGYFFITGRSKEIIVLPTGKKIFPDELEKFYKQIPAIKEICLIQRERGLEAAVVPDFEYLRKKNLPNSRETIAFEIEDLAKNLPPYKRITGLRIFQESLPVTRLGKLRRGKIKELYDQTDSRVEKDVQGSDTALLADPVMKKLISCLEPFSVKKQIFPFDNLELDLGLDSLARVELVVSIEKSFGINLPDTFGSEIFTVKDATVKLKELLAAGQVTPSSNIKMTWSEILAQEPSEDVASSLRIESNIVFDAGRYMIKILLRLVFLVYCKLSVRGINNLPTRGPFIIAPNHLSFADAPLVITSIPWDIAERTFFLGTTDFFGGPISSKIAGVIHVIPVDMDSRLYSAMQLSAHVLRKNKILCVFPEGGRSRDGSTKEFKKGVGIIAKELNIPLIPTAIEGSYALLPPGKSVPKPSKVRVTFGRAIYPDGKDYDAIVKELYQEIVQMLEHGTKL